MKWIGAIFLLPILAIAQERQLVSARETRIEQYVQAYLKAEGKDDVPSARFAAFIAKLGDKKDGFKNDQTFLNYIFAKTHKQFLKHYNTSARFSQLFGNGTYNCLTATALYALILDHFQYRYSVIETNYHIFILVNVNDQRILIETTDPLNGFVASERDITERINKYTSHAVVEASRNKTYYAYAASIYNEVNLENLIGLFHYNLAVEAYNNRQLAASIEYLDKALGFYQSERMNEFFNLVLLTVAESEIQQGDKNSLLKKIKSIRNSKLQLIASSQAN